MGLTLSLSLPRSTGSRKSSENVAENILILITKNLCRRRLALFLFIFLTLSLSLSLSLSLDYNLTLELGITTGSDNMQQIVVCT